MQFPTVFPTLLIAILTPLNMKSVGFHDSKLKFVKALLFHSFHETEAPMACYCSTFNCGRAYCNKKRNLFFIVISVNK